jgi:hypothetical protein
MRRSTLLSNVLLMVIVAVAGCASMDRIDWTGAPITRAMARLGQPTAMRKSGERAVTYEFEQKRDVLCAITTGGGGPAEVPGVPHVQVGGVCGVERRTWTFVVNRTGTIVRWSVGEWQRGWPKERASRPPE